MKNSIIIFIVLFCTACMFAQTDSLEQKLDKYKNLHDKGLIDNKEYKDLKSALLKPAITITDDAPQQKVFTEEELKKLKRSANSYIVVGTVLTAAGVLGVGKAVITYNAGKLAGDAHERDKAIVFGAFGTIFTAGGIACLVKGSIEMSIYNTQKGNLNIGLKPTGPSLIYTFK